MFGNHRPYRQVPAQWNLVNVQIIARVHLVIPVGPELFWSAPTARPRSNVRYFGRSCDRIEDGTVPELSFHPQTPNTPG